MNYSAVKNVIDYENLGSQLINQKDKFQMTPMHIAAINFDIEIFNLLTSLNPDLNLKDSENKTPKDYLNDNEDIDKEIFKQIDILNI